MTGIRCEYCGYWTKIRLEGEKLVCWNCGRKLEEQNKMKEIHEHLRRKKGGHRKIVHVKPIQEKLLDLNKKQIEIHLGERLEKAKTK